jgi:thiosulfate/3-mercaptopyruvate sulfurtransferase
MSARVVLDVRWRLNGPPGIDDYLAAHLPGAVYVDLEAAFSGPAGSGGRHPLPAADDLQRAMRVAGVDDDSSLLIYDDGDLLPASRAWWTLRYFGFTGPVEVLDGGFAAWTGPVTTEVPSVVAGDFTARPGHMPVLDADGAAGLAKTGILLDVRAPERFRGEVEPIDTVAGHIPGAVSAPGSGIFGADGRLNSPAELGARYAALGVAPGVTIGAYCGSGITAAREVYAMHLAGVDAALYVGSWSHWTADPSRLVATGP